MGEEQPLAEHDNESGGVEPPDVIDLRGNGSPGRPSAGVPPDSAATRSLSASEGWDWLDLGLRISEAQLDARRTTSRPMNIDRTDVRVGRAREIPAQSASGRVTAGDWSTWVHLGHTIADPQSEAPPVNGAGAALNNAVELADDDAALDELVADEPAVAEVSAEPEVVVPEVVEPEVVEAEPEVVEPEVVEAEPAVVALAHVVEAKPPGADEALVNVADLSDLVVFEPDTERKDRYRAVRLAAAPLVIILAVVLLIAAVAVALASRGGSPAKPPTSGPTGSSVATKPGLPPAAMTWLDQNTLPGTRVFAPGALVAGIAAGLQGRAVLAYGETATRPGDLIVVNSGSTGIPAGSLTTQVLAAAAIVGRLPGSTAVVRQVTPIDDSGVQTRRAVGTELVQNPALAFTQGSRAALRAGQVDERVLTVLNGLASQHTLEANLAHDLADAPEAPLRTLRIRTWDGHPITSAAVREITAFVTSQQGDLAGPVVARIDDSGTPAVSVRYLLPASFDLLSNGSFPTSEESR